MNSITSTGIAYHRMKLQHGRGKMEDDDELLVLEEGGKYGEHDGDKKKKIKEKNEISETVIIMRHLREAPFSILKSASKPSSICRTPPKLRRLHQYVFNPTLVRIGPHFLYPANTDLSYMRVLKLRFLDRLLDKMTLPDVHDEEQNGTTVHDEEQNGTTAKVMEDIVSQQQSANYQSCSSSSTSTSTNVVDESLSCSYCTNYANYQKKIECLVVAMKELEAYTRACYAEKSLVSSSDYVEMMLIDGCFVVELLRIYAVWGRATVESVDDPIFHTRWVVPTLKQDLIMLENQLPLPVLEKIFNISRPEKDWLTIQDLTLQDLTLKFFNSLLSRKKVYLGKGIVDSKSDHLLGLVRSSFQVPRDLSSGNNPSRLRSWVRIPSRVIHSAIRNIKTCLRIRQTEQDPEQDPLFHEGKLVIHCVTELKEAGISFEKREKHDLLDIDFKNGKLYIPPLLINDYTGLMFLNFVAYEQCYPSTEPYFTTYLLFWDCLLNSAKDVEYLHSKGIIDHVLGSDEDVAQLFNKLCREVAHDLGDCYLRKVFKDVNDYFGVTRHRWRAKWKHEYFNSPWSFISLIAAVFLLILTFLQTFFGVFSYFVPSS